jgi:hypothetical protein
MLEIEREGGFVFVEGGLEGLEDTYLLCISLLVGSGRSSQLIAPLAAAKMEGFETKIIAIAKMPKAIARLRDILNLPRVSNATLSFYLLKRIIG